MLLNLPFALPDWMPPWVFLLLALPVLLWALAFVLMPFSVFGVKGRLESLEAQVESLHEDLRMMSLRASGVLPPAPSEFHPYDDVPNFTRIKKSHTAYEEPARAAPPPIATPVVTPRERFVPAPPPKPLRRTEPRLD